MVNQTIGTGVTSKGVHEVNLHNIVEVNIDIVRSWTI